SPTRITASTTHRTLQETTTTRSRPWPHRQAASRGQVIAEAVEIIRCLPPTTRARRSLRTSTRRGWPPAIDVTESDSPFAQVIRRQFQRDLVAGKDADVMLAHLAARVRDELVAIVERHTEPLIRQHFVDDTVHFKMFFLRHSAVLRK